MRTILGPTHPELDHAVQLSLIGYARVIAVRTAIGVKKRKRVREARDDGTLTDTVPCERPSPSEDAAADERRSVIRALLAQLPEEQSETLALRIGLGCSIEEIAAQTRARATPPSAKPFR